MFLLIISLSAVAFAEGEGSGNSEFTWVLAVGLSLVHLATPWLKPVLDRFEVQVSSFGGGASISYVFLHLLPELDEDNGYVKGHIYGVVLIGFIIIYGLKTIHEDDERLRGRSALVQACIYSWLLIYGLGGEHGGDLKIVLLATLALSFHLIHEDHGLAQEHPWIFQTKSRLLLASMPLVGLASRTYLNLREETLASLVTAILAGVIMYNSFEDGLPAGNRRAALGWFVAGATVFSGFLVFFKSLP